MRMRSIASSRTCLRRQWRTEPPLLGVLNINKPRGLTSFDVVARVRQATGVRRVGHAGTLDPLATGVLLVCLGQATRIIQYLQDAPKVYLADIKLGQRTDTYDAEGRVTEELPLSEHLDLGRFEGDIWQTPPLYSALKHEGRPLYTYARKGQPVEVRQRRVRIDRIELVSWSPPCASLRVWCGKGTYIRSLANDLGGHLTALVREAVGSFRIEQAIDLDRLSAWENEVMPIAAALPDMPQLAVDAEQAARLRNGLAIPAPDGEALTLDARGEAVAIVRDGKPKIVFEATA
jgi:tRNA pseudouridine55 synthase